MQKFIFIFSYSTEPVDCDGVPEKDNAEDEDLDQCIKQGAFPESATTNCTMPGLQNTTYSIEIMAIPCNNVVECEGGVDEEGCDGNKTVLYVGLGIGLVMSLVLSGIATWITWFKASKVSEPPQMPGSEEYQLQKILFSQSKTIAEREQQNLETFGPDLSVINSNPAEAYNKAKVRFNLSAYNVLCLRIHKELIS